MLPFIEILFMIKLIKQFRFVVRKLLYSLSALDYTPNQVMP